jgi:bifunctional UDP-N-acetylglucosamine pyrophosphorylase/glucosamine-1-phosphate N-acetyltransferase/UDP-N-acetylglucosamine pyrophosphorylase
MIEYVLEALFAGGVQRAIVVVGYQAALVRSTLDGRPGIDFAFQAEQLGTGHAVMSCREHLLDHDGPVLIVTGDAPLMQAASIAGLLAEYQRRPAACILGTAYKADPAGLGRIVRNSHGDFQAIVEHRDASKEQLRITEVNMSYYVFHGRDLLDVLADLRPNNQQGEYYITDAPGLLASRGKEVRAVPILKPCEALSINTLDELAVVEQEMHQTRNSTLESPIPNPQSLSESSSPP